MILFPAFLVDLIQKLQKLSIELRTILSRDDAWSLNSHHAYPVDSGSHNP